MLLRVTVAVVAAIPAFSVIEAAVTTTVRFSISVTPSVSAPLLYAAADAVIVAVCVPSRILSSTASMSNVTDAIPAGIVIVAGTVASVVSSLASVTVSALAVSVLLRETVAVVAAAPAFSATSAAAMTTDKLSTSVTLSVSTPSI